MRHPFLLLCFVSSLFGATSAETSAWEVLNHALSESNPAKRVQAITALSSIGDAPHVFDLLEAGLNDKDAMVRQSAAAVLGEARVLPAIPLLKKALDDDSAEVSFTAARSLWEMGDRSGREILWAVLAGEQKTGPGMIEGGIRDAKSKLHNPRALAKIGIDQAAGFLGPFSMGVWFAEDLMKDKGAPARALSAKLLASDTEASTAEQLEQALEDKNPAVRAAAARAIGARAKPEKIAKLEPLLTDSNDGVRDMAAAAIIRLSQPLPQSPARRRPKVSPVKGNAPEQPAK